MSPSRQASVRRVSGFGMHGAVDGYVFRPDSIAALAELIERAGQEGRRIALRGAGRSYGDASTLNEEFIVDIGGLNKLDIDPSTGIATAECGVTFEDLWRAGLPMGFWLPVVSGTMAPTLGGALAMNVHGKNAFCAGTLGEHVEEIEALDGQGQLHTLTPKDRRFFEVISSAGTLAAIVRVKLRLKPVSSGRLDVAAVSCRNWSEQFGAFEDHRADADYMVSWIDAFATGAGAGRGLFHAAWNRKAVEPESLLPANQDLPTKALGIIPKSQMWRLMKLFNHAAGVRAINAAKYLSSKRARSEKRFIQSLVEFTFLLDYIPDWRKIYEPKGFAQVQIFVPDGAAQSLFPEVMAALQVARSTPFLVVMKRHRPDDFLFSHGVDGYSLAMDFKLLDDLAALGRIIEPISDRVIEANGKFYFAKDSLLTADQARRYLGEETLQRYRLAKASLDPLGVFDTNLARRLDLT